MKTQFDHQIRVVSLENLRAMCEMVSGSFCHKYRVTKISRSRVHIEYSNENEYACPNPMVAVFPIYPSGNRPEDKDNPSVVLEYLNILYDNCNGEGWQCFEILRDCPILWRDPNTGQWQTENEIAGRDSANAQAIAAVPDMIEALQLIHQCLGYMKENHLGSMTPAMLEALDSTITALRKAGQID